MPESCSLLKTVVVHFSYKQNYYVDQDIGEPVIWWREVQDLLRKPISNEEHAWETGYVSSWWSWKSGATLSPLKSTPVLPKSQKVEPSDCVFVLVDVGLILLYCVLVILIQNSMFVLCQCVVEVVAWFLDSRSLWVRVLLASHIRYVLESFNPSSYETLWD